MYLNFLKRYLGLAVRQWEDLIAEIGLDMDVFPTEKHLASCAGVCPDTNESAGEKNPASTTETNKSKL